MMSVIAWMAGLFYLPRLFVNHVERSLTNPELGEIFAEMEVKLLKVIMGPAMMSTWLFGIILAITPGVIDWSSFWPWIKMIMVIGMTMFHIWCSKRHKLLVAGQNTLTGRQLRLINEVPTVLMAVIVIMIVVKPF
jgi:putative membrane protein